MNGVNPEKPWQVILRMLLALVLIAMLAPVVIGYASIGQIIKWVKP